MRGWALANNFCNEGQRGSGEVGRDREEMRKKSGRSMEKSGKKRDGTNCVQNKVITSTSAEECRPAFQHGAALLQQVGAAIGALGGVAGIVRQRVIDQSAVDAA